MTNDGTGGTFTYDLANNMITASKINSATYKYNSLHQRVEKAVTVSGVTTKTYYIYDTNNLLLGEYDSSGNAISEHIYLNNIPVAVSKGTNTYFVHTDYLNTPRAISNSSGALVWKWDNTNAYGFNPANETVSGTAFEYNPRFAGQYFDKETGLHYNLNRMYNPQLARYMQPDPIGVNGGMNIYSYVENNPLNYNDPEGLFQEIDGSIRQDVNFNYIHGRSVGIFEGKSLFSSNIKHAIYNEYYIYTDNIKNQKDVLIEVGYYIGGKPISHNFDPRFNCHGWSFFQGRGWINDDQVKKILEMDYIEVNFNDLRNGDVIIYFENNEIRHSALAVNSPMGWSSIGKDGVRPGLQVRNIEAQWPLATSRKYYRYWKNQ